MLLRQMLDVYDLIDKPQASGQEVADYLRKHGAGDVTVERVSGERGGTDCIKVVIPGKNGKSSGGSAPTLGIVGRLGGLGARPEMIGAVSDGDGAVAALTAALKLTEMHENGDVLEGDVIVATHVCPDAPTLPHEPVPFMDSPIDMETMNRMEVDARMDAIVSIDTTKGNRIINLNGIAISPTVMQGYILSVSNDLMDVMTRVTTSIPSCSPPPPRAPPSWAWPLPPSRWSPAAPRVPRMAPTLRKPPASPWRSPRSMAPVAASSSTRSSSRTSRPSTATWSASRASARPSRARRPARITRRVADW